MWAKSKTMNPAAPARVAKPMVVEIPRALRRQFDAERIRAAAEALLAVFDERVRRVLEVRYGLRDGHPRTLQAVGSAEGLTRERIRQIEAFAMRSLDRPQRPLPERVQEIRAAIGTILVQLGRASHEGVLCASLGLTDPKDQAAFRFLLAATPGVTEARETQRTARHWTVSAPAEAGEVKTAVPSIEQVLETAEMVLGERGEPISEPSFLVILAERLRPAPTTRSLLLSHLAIARRLARNPFGEWGKTNWPTITPRGAGDKACLILRQRGKPLHYGALADEVNNVFPSRRTHPQTVHNELIRDPRFVLVGRGTYALKEWGYEPGTVAEITAKILAKSGRLLARDELIAAVLKQRQVKRNTVLLALGNRKLFHVLEDGRVELAAQEYTAVPKPTAASHNGMVP